MPNELFKQLFLLLITVLLGATVLNVLDTQTDLMVSWCLILTARGYRRSEPTE